MTDELKLPEKLSESAETEPSGDNNDEKKTEEVTNEQEEEADDEEEEEEEDAYIVKEVTDVRLVRGAMQFKTIWETDGSTTWEPIESFPEGEEHVEILRFKAKFPEKFADKLQKSKRKQTTSKLWTYVPVESITEKHEQVDANATSREAKSLYDPNRLEDPEEAFLKNYDTGVRVSRSKSREMRMNIESSSADSSICSTNDEPPPKKQSRGGQQVKKERVKKEDKEKKTAAPRRRKRAEKPCLLDSVPSTDTVPTMPTPPETPQPGASRPVAPSAPLGYKLNSSDSSDEDSDHEPPPLRGKEATKKLTSAGPGDSETAGSSSITKKRAPGAADIYPFPISKLPPIPKKASAVESAVSTEKTNARKKHHHSEKHIRKRSPPPEEVWEIREEGARYKGDWEKEEKERRRILEEMFGPDQYAGETHEETKERDLAERKSRQLIRHNLAKAITNHDLNSCELILLEKSPQDALEVITGHELPLHSILVDTYSYFHQNLFAKHDKARTQCALVFRRVLPYLPNDIFAVVNGQQNTLINLAINARSLELVELFCALGSPLNIPNCFGASAVEAALMCRLPQILEILLQYGSTFHYFVGEHLEDFDGEYLERARRNLVLAKEPEKSELTSLLEGYYTMIDRECREIRSPAIRSSFRELDFGPVITFARGKLMYHGDKREAQFKMPTQWMHFGEKEEFKLVVIPMGWHPHDKRFYGAPQATKMQPPCINGVPCHHIGGILYDATEAMSVKKNKYDALKRHKEENPSDPRPLPKGTLCSLRIRFDPTEPLHFVACQLVRCLRKAPPVSVTPPNFNQTSSSYYTPYSTPSNSSFRFSSPTGRSSSSTGRPPATPRI